MPDLSEEARRSMIAAAEKLLATERTSTVTLDTVAAEAGVERAVLAEQFPAVSDLFREILIESTATCAQLVDEQLAMATDGSDAITRHITTCVDFYERRQGAFRATFLMPQLAGREASGHDDETLANVFLNVNRKFDRLEEMLDRERGPTKLAGGLHPRRLAYAAELAFLGLCTAHKD